MRDFMLAEALARNELVPAIRRVFSNWKARRALKQLRDLDDRMLKDIGVTRIDLEQALALPWSENPALHLERTSFAGGRIMLYERVRRKSGEAIEESCCGFSPAATAPWPR
ncbi:MAG: DUF1127 domain-containing protein [Hyphomicrobiaceae bacterium]|nr:MAG: DUF1127 domain-containing protein [Hyphomicrobiaceae bacterium]